MTPGGLIADPTTGPQAGAHLASCPGQLTIKAGATCRLERGKHADRRELAYARPTRRCRRPGSESGSLFLAALGDENSRTEGQNVR
jgi:hypothetical protein